MIKKILLGLTLLLALSCNKDEGDASIKQETGNVWLSGGLAYCAEQIHLDNGDKLIFKMEDIISLKPFIVLKSGDRVNIKYREIGLNGSCTPGIDCEIIEIKKVQ